jgi:hypothetical protein
MHSLIINLDLSIEKRYENIVKLFDVKAASKNLNEIYENFLPKIPMVNNMISLSVKANKKKIIYKDEIKYWSKILDLPFHKIMILQLLFELYAGCTTVVHKNVMYRTMDWPLEFMRDITYEAKFIKDSKPIYEGVCWLGCIGIFTGKNEEFSIAINHRKIKSKTVFDYVKGLFTKYSNAISTYWPVSYVVRHIFENQLSKFEAFSMLNGQPVISPTYYILNYFENLQPVIFQRDMKSCTRISGDYVIQTNSDSDTLDKPESENIIQSKERFIYVKNLIESGQNLSDNFEKEPVVNKSTIYTCIMSKDSIRVF